MFSKIIIGGTYRCFGLNHITNITSQQMKTTIVYVFIVNLYVFRYIFILSILYFILYDRYQYFSGECYRYVYEIKQKYKHWEL